MEWMMMLCVVMVTTLLSHYLVTTAEYCDDDGVCYEENQYNETKYMYNPPSSEVQQVCNEGNLVRIHSTCKANKLSCRQRCPGVLNTGNVTRDPLDTLFPCHCDARCHAYGDCCHDFQQTCKMENENFYTAFSRRNQPKTKCVSNRYTVIDSCLEKTDTRGKDEHLHSMDYVVTDGLTGLHFINYTIFSCNMEPDSRAIFWNKELGTKVSETISRPVPPPQIDGRKCNTYFKMSCGRPCYINGYPSHFGTLCQTVPQNDSNMMTPQINQSDEIVAPKLCILTGEGAIKSPLQFSILTSLSGSLEIIRPIDHSAQSWDEAECFGRVSFKTCRVRKCQDSYFQIGQTCLLPLGINITLEFIGDLERKLFDKNTLLGLLDGAWGGLKNDFTSTLESSEAGGNMYQVLYKLLNVTYIKFDQDQLPFTQQIVTELENVIEEDTRQVKIIPTTVKVCVNMEKKLKGQMEAQLNASNKLSFVSEEYSYDEICDVITLFNSESASDWLISSEYNKIAGAMKTGKSDGNSRMRCRLFSGCAMPLVVFLFGVKNVILMYGI